MADGSYPPIPAPLASRSDQKSVGLGRRLVSGLVFAAGLVVVGLIAVVSVAVALVATVLNAVRALKPKR